MFYPSESSLMSHIANHPRLDFSKGFFSEIIRLILSAYFGQGMFGQPKENNVAVLCFVFPISVVESNWWQWKRP